MDSSRVLLALQEQKKWEGRKNRIEEKLKKIRAKKRSALSELEQVKNRIMQLVALPAIQESDISMKDIPVRIDGLR